MPRGTSPLWNSWGICNFYYIWVSPSKQAHTHIHKLERTHCALVHVCRLESARTCLVYSGHAFSYAYACNAHVHTHTITCSLSLSFSILILPPTIILFHRNISFHQFIPYHLHPSLSTPSIPHLIVPYLYDSIPCPLASSIPLLHAQFPYPLNPHTLPPIVSNMTLSFTLSCSLYLSHSIPLPSFSLRPFQISLPPAKCPYLPPCLSLIFSHAPYISCLPFVLPSP